MRKRVKYQKLKNTNNDSLKNNNKIPKNENTLSSWKKDFVRGYHFTEDIISLPFILFFIVSTIVKLCLLVIFGFGIYEIYQLGKYIYDNFEKLESLIKKYIEEIIKDIENLIQKIKSFF